MINLRIEFKKDGMKVIRNRLLPLGRRYYAINLCGVVFAKGPCDDKVLNHEAIHTAQMKELLVIGFYVWYLLEWIVKSVRYRGFHKGYLNIRFEREAYMNDANLSYLKIRRPFAFLKRNIEKKK